MGWTAILRDTFEKVATQSEFFSEYPQFSPVTGAMAPSVISSPDAREGNLMHVEAPSPPTGGTAVGFKSTNDLYSNGLRHLTRVDFIPRKGDVNEEPQ